MRVRVAVIALCGCSAAPAMNAFPNPFGPDPEPSTPGTVEVALDHLQPGWRVTTTRSIDQNPPSEVTQTSDGTPIGIAGTAKDVFVVTVTDQHGALIATRAMTSPCTTGNARLLPVPSDYSTIQEAIDAAEPGDTVQVGAGLYHESVTMRPGICLLGSGAANTVLDAQGESRTLVDLTSAPGSVVGGFTLRRTVSNAGCDPKGPFDCSGDWYRAAIYIGGTTWEDPTHDGPPIIIDNVFDGNDVGVMFYWRSNAVLRNNVFVHNMNAFVANHFQDRALVANNVFLSNTNLAIGNDAAYLDIFDNIIVGSSVGIQFRYVQAGHIQCNLFWMNGIDQLGDDLPRFEIGVDGNLEADPRLNADFHLQRGSPAIDAGCHPDAPEPDGSSPDLGVYGGPLARWIDL